jgi:hypothetical protein
MNCMSRNAINYFCSAIRIGSLITRLFSFCRIIPIDRSTIIFSEDTIFS